MSRIATITTVLTLAFVPAAFAKPLDLRSPDQQAAHRTAMTKVFSEDLRSPDAVEVVTPASAHDGTVAGEEGLSTWALLAIIAGALIASALLIVMLRRAFAVGRPVGA